MGAQKSKKPPVSAATHPTLLLPVFMRHPAWRWQTALQLVQSEPFSVASVSSDKLLSDFAFFLRAKLVERVPDGQLATKYPDIFIPHAMYRQYAPYGLKWQLEAMLLAEASDTEIAEQFPGLTARHVEVFSKLFFDVRSYSKRDCALLQKVIGSAQFGDPSERIWDYVWKSYALSFDFKRLLAFISPRTTYTDETQLNWLRQLHEKNMITQMTAVSANLRKGYIDQVSETLSATTKVMQVPDNRNQLTDLLQMQENIKALSGAFDVVLKPAELPAGNSKTK